LATFDGLTYGLLVKSANQSQWVDLGVLFHKLREFGGGVELRGDLDVAVPENLLQLAEGAAGGDVVIGECVPKQMATELG